MTCSIWRLWIYFKNTLIKGIFTLNRQYFHSNISQPYLFHNTVDHTLKLIISVISSTFGPGGTHNIFLNGAEIRASKDGLENLTMIKMDGTIPRAIHQMLMNVAASQANDVGDGTSSAILIAAAVYSRLRNDEVLWDKYTNSEIYDAMQQIQHELIKRLTEYSFKISEDAEVTDVIHTSTDANKDLTDTLFDLYKNVDNIANKNILIDYSSTNVSYFKTVQGVELYGKLMSKAFGNKNDVECNLQNVEILIIDGKVNIMNDILTYVNKLKVHNKSLLVICSGVNENFYRYIEGIHKSQPELLKNFCVAYSTANTIMDKDTFYDILNITNCGYLQENTEISTDSIDQLIKGEASRVVIKNNRITLGGFTQSDSFIEYLDGLNTDMIDISNQLTSGQLDSDTVSKLTIQKNSLLTRYHKLKDGVTTLFIGGDSPQRKSILYRLAEDGLKALQSTLAYGYFYGCNTTVPNTLSQMMYSQLEIDKGNPSIYYHLEMVILEAYVDVYKKLISNSANIEDIEIMKIIMGPNFETNYDDMNDKILITDGKPLLYPIDLRGDGHQILNPAKTDINIIQKSLDVALLLATTNTILTDQLEFEGTLD